MRDVLAEAGEDDFFAEMLPWTDGEEQERILADLLAQGYRGEDLLDEFRDRCADPIEWITDEEIF